MGCNQSKAIDANAHKLDTVPTSPMSAASYRSISLPRDINKISDPGERLFELLLLSSNVKSSNDFHDQQLLWARIVKICDKTPVAAQYIDPQTGDTPLHLACRILCKFPFDPLRGVDEGNGNSNMNGNMNGGGEAVSPLDAIRTLTRSDPDIAGRTNKKGNIALHEIILASSKYHSDASLNHQTQVINLLIAADYETTVEYLSRNDVTFDKDRSRNNSNNIHHNNHNSQRTGGCTPLYHAVSSIPDDFSTPPGPTVEFISSLHFPCPHMVSRRNACPSNHDKPLALLYRRFSRQFDLSEKFFPGDNSREEVVNHRNRYKTAAMNTWKIIIALLDPLADKKKSVSDFFMVHAAVRVDCPPDLLRYIIETRPQEVRQTNEQGRLPLHVASASENDMGGTGYHYKFVIDELLYAYPEACAEKDADNKLPLELAVQSGKTWIGGGTKSLYDVFPDAMSRVRVEEFPRIKSALSFSTNFAEEREAEAEAEEKNPIPRNATGGGSGGAASTSGIVKEEHYDAIMMVQKPDANLGDIISAMWANEEDGGVQMLGCVAISRIASIHKDDQNMLRSISLTAVTTVVNAMKNHPNEPAVQEKACIALRLMAPSDNFREVSFAASGAAASIVAAMQAHVSDAIVQREACTALRHIVRYGGADRATVIASVSGFTALQNALGAHPDDVHVQKEACLTLDALTSFPDANLPDLPGSQTAPLLEVAKKKHPFECQDTANRVLARLS